MKKNMAQFYSDSPTYPKFVSFIRAEIGLPFCPLDRYPSTQSARPPATQTTRPPSTQLPRPPSTQQSTRRPATSQSEVLTTTLSTSSTRATSRSTSTRQRPVVCKKRAGNIDIEQFF